MNVSSKTKYQRMSPKKGHDLAREIQGKPAGEALSMLEYSPRKASQLMYKTLKSAIANAEHNHELDVDDLVIKEAAFEDGPIMRRGWYGARGQFKPIAKRTCHVRVMLTDGQDDTEEIESEDDE